MVTSRQAIASKKMMLGIYPEFLIKIEHNLAGKKLHHGLGGGLGFLIEDLKDVIISDFPDHIYVIHMQKTLRHQKSMSRGYNPDRDSTVRKFH